MSSIDLGCGPNKRADIGIDFYPYPGVDIVWDLSRFPWPIKTASFHRAEAHQVLEHLPVHRDVAGTDLLFRFCEEVWRILRPGGVFELDVPHVQGPFAFGDPTHRRHFTERSFNWLLTGDRDDLYPRRRWDMESLQIDRAYWMSWHVNHYLPRVHAVLTKVGFGAPSQISVRLRKKVDGNP